MNLPFRRKKHEKSLRFQNALLELAKIKLMDLDAFFANLTEIDARELEVDRVSIWLFQNDQSEIFCHDLYLATRRVHEKGMILRAEHFPNYFRELEKSRTIAANDAQSDPRTNEFTEGYLKPNQIYSMLDVPVWLQGKVKGIVCHEHTGKKRKWTLEEQQFVASIATIVSLSLENAQLQETQMALQLKSIELERSNQELKSFAYVASHDLQEPLHKIIAFGDRLKMNALGELNEKGLDSLERIQKSAMGMRDFINDLLLYSKVTKRDLPFEKVPLVPLIKEVLKELEVRIAETKATIVLGFIPPTLGDPLQLRQLFLNLIANSLKFTKNGDSPWIRIYGESVDPQSLHVIIEDHGIGFDEKYSELIFRPFERLHPKDHYEGTGMGLAICKKIVLAHRGTIAVKSKMNEGTVFTVTLPRG